MPTMCQLGVSGTAVGGGGTATSVQLTSVAGSPYEYFGMATAGVNGWVAPTNPGTGTPYSWTSWPLLGQITTSPTNNAGPAPSGVGGNIPYVWLAHRVPEQCRQLGLASRGRWLRLRIRPRLRLCLPPLPISPEERLQCAPFLGGAGYPPAGQCYNPISPAILILQQLQQSVATAAATGPIRPTLRNRQQLDSH